MKNFRTLMVWQKSQELALQIYRITKVFPVDERFRLIDQMCRAAVSIPSNIAEGCGRSGDRELAHFFTIAKDSTNELDSQLLLAKNLGYLRDEAYHDVMTRLEEIQRMLAAFILKIHRDAA
jgi:four helix bundle protein